VRQGRGGRRDARISDFSGVPTFPSEVDEIKVGAAGGRRPRSFQRRRRGCKIADRDETLHAVTPSGESQGDSVRQPGVARHEPPRVNDARGEQPQRGCVPSAHIVADTSPSPFAAVSVPYLSLMPFHSVFPQPRPEFVLGHGVAGVTQPRWGCYCGVYRRPRVARSSQPWASRYSPVGAVNAWPTL